MIDSEPDRPFFWSAGPLITHKPFRKVFMNNAMAKEKLRWCVGKVRRRKKSPPGNRRTGILILPAGFHQPGDQARATLSAAFSVGLGRMTALHFSESAL